MKNKEIKLTHTTWKKIMDTKQKHNVKQAEYVIIAYQKLVSEYKLHEEFEKVLNKFEKTRQ